MRLWVKPRLLYLPNLDFAANSKAYTSESFLSKATFWRTFRCGIHTHASFYLRKSTFKNNTSSIPEFFLSQMVSCDWPWNATFNLQLSLFNLQLQVCHVELSQVTCERFLAQATFARNIQMCHRLDSHQMQNVLKESLRQITAQQSGTHRRSWEQHPVAAATTNQCRLVLFNLHINLHNGIRWENQLWFYRSIAVSHTNQHWVRSKTQKTAKDNERRRNTAKDGG